MATADYSHISSQPFYNHSNIRDRVQTSLLPSSTNNNVTNTQYRIINTLEITTWQYMKLKVACMLWVTSKECKQLTHISLKKRIAMFFVLRYTGPQCIVVQEIRTEKLHGIAIVKRTQQDANIRIKRVIATTDAYNEIVRYSQQWCNSHNGMFVNEYENKINADRYGELHADHSHND